MIQHTAESAVGQHVVYLSDNLTIHDWRFLDKLLSSQYRVTLATGIAGPLPASIMGLHDRGLGLERLSRPRVPKADWYLYALRAWSLRSILRRLKPDLLHAGYVPTSGFTAALSGYHPWLLMPWGSDVLVTPKEQFFARLVVRFTLKRADRITCDCETVRQAIGQLTGRTCADVTVIPWGIELGQFHPNAAKSTIRNDLGWVSNQVIVYNRGFHDIYGWQYLLDAFATLRRTHPSARLVLIGGGAVQLARSRAVEIGVEDVVHFTGPVPNQDMPGLLAAADVFVSPSLSDGSPASVMEAMAVGLPIVVTDVPAVMEWISDGATGYVCRRGDAADLATALQRALDDSDRAHVGSRAAAVARVRADWDANFQAVERLYQELVRR